MTRPDIERVWLQFAISATGNMASIDALVDDDVLTEDAARIADRMVIKWRERYDAAALEAERATARTAEIAALEASTETAQW